MKQQATMKPDPRPVVESERFVFRAGAEVETVEPGIRRQFLGFNESLMAVRVWFDEGAVGQVHSHPHTQVSYVESGRFDVTVGGETKTMVAGDSFFVAPDALHGAVCREAGVLIDMFAPMREDFLKEETRS